MFHSMTKLKKYQTILARPSDPGSQGKLLILNVRSIPAIETAVINLLI